MNLEEIRLLIEKEVSPKQYQLDSEIYGFHYGAVNNKKNLKKIMLTVDLSLNALYFAIKNKINFIISINGLITNSIKNFKPNLINKLSILSKYPISIFVLGSSFVAAEGGVSDTIMDALFLNLDHSFEIRCNNNHIIPIGRVCAPNPYPGVNETFNLESLIKRIRSNLKIQSIFYLGELKKKISKICIIGGEDLFIKYFDEALNQKCDCYITGRVNRSICNQAFDLGINIIEIPFFNCEILALKKMCNFLSLKFPYDEFFLFNSKNPLKLYINS